MGKEKVTDVVIVEEKEQSDLIAEINKKVPQLFIDAQRNLILNETPRYQVKKRKGKAGLIFDYVKIGYVIEQLNNLTGFRWNWKTFTKIEDILEISLKIGEFIVQGRLTVFGADGRSAYRDGEGSAEIQMKKDGKGYLCVGSDFKASVSDCIKKAASRCGIALDVYSGATKRRQDSTHPEAVITEEQKIRLESVAKDAKLGGSGLIKLISEMYDYKNIKDVQRQHFAIIMNKLEGMEVDVHMSDIPERMQLGFDVLNIPKAKRLAVYRSYEKNGTLEELEAKIQAKIKEQKDAKK